MTAQGTLISSSGYFRDEVVCPDSRDHVDGSREQVVCAQVLTYLDDVNAAGHSSGLAALNGIAVDSNRNIGIHESDLIQ